MIPGELPIEGLATGTVFSFLWNMLVSISFQFVGFLLTYLMHTTHAAKLGARAGLGLTLVQYGFAIKSNREDLASGGGDITWTSNGDSAAEPRPPFDTAAEADAWYATHPNATFDDASSQLLGGDSFFTSDSTSEWLAFLLMTIGTCTTPYPTKCALSANLFHHRLVCFTQLSAWLLAHQALGAFHPRFARRKPRPSTASPCKPRPCSTKQFRSSFRANARTASA